MAEVSLARKSPRPHRRQPKLLLPIPPFPARSFGGRGFPGHPDSGALVEKPPHLVREPHLPGPLASTSSILHVCGAAPSSEASPDTDSEHRYSEGLTPPMTCLMPGGLVGPVGCGPSMVAFHWESSGKPTWPLRPNPTPDSSFNPKPKSKHSTTMQLTTSLRFGLSFRFGLLFLTLQQPARRERRNPRLHETKRIRSSHLLADSRHWVTPRSSSFIRLSRAIYPNDFITCAINMLHCTTTSLKRTTKSTKHATTNHNAGNQFKHTTLNAQPVSCSRLTTGPNVCTSLTGTSSTWFACFKERNRNENGVNSNELTTSALGFGLFLGTLGPFLGFR